MRKKRLLFVLSSFDIGGTTVSTRNLISVLDKEKYDISIWVLSPEGILKPMYEGVKTIPSCFYARSLAISGWRQESGLLRRIGAAVIRGLSNKSIFFYKVICRLSINKCTKGYLFDTVVACQEGFLSSFVSNFECNNRIAWVRCDYKRYLLENKEGVKESFYNKYDHIVCVAEDSCKGFIEVYPNLKDKITCIYNPQDNELIKFQSDIDDHDSRFIKDKNVIVSVGRLSKVKRFTEIPQIAKKLVDRGFEFKWFIIGDGEEKSDILENIMRNKVMKNVIMLGAKSNPHYYIKRADLYVCLSSSEACPRVINEAKILGTPVVSTDFPTVYEYIEDGVNGRIVSLKYLTDAIAELLQNKGQYDYIKKEIKKFTFDNSTLIEKLEQVL